MNDNTGDTRWEDPRDTVGGETDQDRGFAIVPEAERGRKPTPGEDLDFRLQLDEQTFDALSDRIGRLEAQVMVLSDAVTILQAMAFGLISTE